MSFIADLHIHSKYSRATSRDMEVETLARWAGLKGIDLLGTGDFTHPLYLAELQERLTPAANGLYRLKKGNQDVTFMLSVEVSNIFSQGGRLRKIHSLIFAPSFEVVEKINARLAKKGNLSADGRPTFGFPVKDLLKLVLDVSADCLLVPAHAWTPWFSVFGARSGFDSLEECFGEQAQYIYAIETGLSSDPPMNWRLSALDKISLISNSDAHSPAKLGREANLLDCELDYYAIMDTIRRKDKDKFPATLEFFPQEGKYHYDGHRACNVLFAPEQSRARDNLCPVCRRPLTIGVMHRVEKLADRPPGFVPPQASGVKHLIPLVEIIAASMERGVATKGVQEKYQQLLKSAGSEFDILLNLPLTELKPRVGEDMVEAISRVRKGQVKITPGYDGVYGKIQLWDEDETHPSKQPKQLSLF